MTLPDASEPPIASALAEPLLPAEEGRPQDPVVELASDPSEIIVHQVRVEGGEIFVDESPGDGTDETFEQGQPQAPYCRDACFALLFLLQLGLVLSLAGWGIYNLCMYKDWDSLPDVPGYDDDHSDDGDDISPIRILLFLLATVASILVLSGVLMVLLLSALAEMMIQISLVISPLTCGLSSVVLLVMGNYVAAGSAALVAAISIYYAVHVWHRIPYAAANVATAVQAIRANRGVFTTAYIVSLATTLFTILWFFALGQVIYTGVVFDCAHDGTSTNYDDCQLSVRGKWILAAFLLSWFWTVAVFKNVFQVTIAGVVGTWWFAPQDCETPARSCFCKCCSAPLQDSWTRATIYSLGSVCLGSLVLAILQVLKFFVSAARQQQEDENRRQGQRPQVSLVWCLLQCLVNLLEKLVKYINQWAFVYVGLYGYDYWSSSKKVYQLFQSRGWSVILNDQLVYRCLGMMKFWNAIIAGALGVVFGILLQVPGTAATFCVGFFLGLSLSDIVLQVVSSAINTIVVCFAEAPRPLEQNHPQTFDRLVSAWRSAYPSEFTY